MLIKRTNIEEKLSKARTKSVNADSLLAEVYQLLKEDTESAARIEANLTSTTGPNTNSFNFDLLDGDKIYHVHHIQKICIDYRLRFLAAKYFKGDMPVDAISSIKDLERKHNIEIKGFKIIAPSKLFKLKDKDDPLLFAPIGNDYYYLVHKWGNDLHPLRKLLMWPFKNMVNLALSVFFASYFVSLMVPEGLFSKSSSNAQFWIVFFFIFKSIAAIVIFYGVALGKNFNPSIWNSKYFNA